MKRKRLQTTTIHVRVAPGLRTQVALAAGGEDRTVSDWVRQQLRTAVQHQQEGQIVDAPQQPADAATSSELSAVGSVPQQLSFLTSKDANPTPLSAIYPITTPAALKFLPSGGVLVLSSSWATSGLTGDAAYHQVQLDRWGVLGCSCKAYQYSPSTNKTCKHISVVAQMVVSMDRNDETLTPKQQAFLRRAWFDSHVRPLRPRRSGTTSLVDRY